MRTQGGTRNRIQVTGHRTLDTRHRAAADENREGTRNRIQVAVHRTQDTGHMIQDISR